MSGHEKAVEAALSVVDPTVWKRMPAEFRAKATAQMRLSVAAFLRACEVNADCDDPDYVKFWLRVIAEELNPTELADELEQP